MLSSDSFVLYKPTNEVGRIKMLNTNTAWVVFKCNNDWDNHINYTSQQCNLDTLELIDTKIFYSIWRSIGTNQIELPSVTRERKALAKMAMFTVGIDPNIYNSQEIINGLCNILTDHVGATYVPEDAADMTIDDIGKLFSHDMVKPTDKTVQFRINVGFHDKNF